jgi:hypothetical protein
MPNLGQLDTSIYGQTKLFPAPGQQAATGRPLAGPTAAQMKFVADQQTEDQINQLAQQYGDDYDGFVNAVAQTHPDRGYAAGKALEEWRKTGAERYKAQSEASSAGIDAGLKLLQGADETNIGERVDSILKENPRLAPVLMPLKANFTPEGLQAVQQIGMNQKEFWDWQARAGDAILNGDKMKGLAAAYAGASSPDQRAIVDRTLKLGGYGKLVGMYPDQQSAQTAFQQMDALKPEKGTEKGGQAKEGIYQGKRTFGVFDPNTNTFMVDGKQVSASEFRPIAPQSAGGGGGTASMSTPEIKPGTAWYRTAQDVAYGKLTFSQLRTLLAGMRGGTAAAQKIAFYDKAREINPNFNPAAFEMGYKYAGNPKTQNTLVSIDNALANFDKAVELSNALDRTDYPSVNKLLAAGKFQLGGKPVTNVQQFQTILGDDIALAIGQGAPSDYKTKLAQSLLNNNLSKDNLISTLKQAGEFLQNRKTAILRQEGPYGEKDFNPSANAPTPQVMGGGGNIPQSVASVLKTAGPGVHTLSDGSKWRVEVNGTITKAN